MSTSGFLDSGDDTTRALIDDVIRRARECGHRLATPANEYGLVGARCALEEHIAAQLRKARADAIDECIAVARAWERPVNTKVTSGEKP